MLQIRLNLQPEFGQYGHKVQSHQNSMNQMAKLIKLNTFTDERGSLSVVENEIGFRIKRIFYLYHIPSNSLRGQHRHKITKEALIPVYGSCKIYCNNGKKEHYYLLDKPSQCLLVDPEDWRKLYNFSKNIVLLVLASEYFDSDDYIYEPYKQP